MSSFVVIQNELRRLADDAVFEDAIHIQGPLSRYVALRNYFEERLAERELSKAFLLATACLYFKLEKLGWINRVVPDSERMKVSGIPKMAAAITVYLTLED